MSHELDELEKRKAEQLEREKDLGREEARVIKLAQTISLPFRLLLELRSKQVRIPYLNIILTFRGANKVHASSRFRGQTRRV